jgi:polyisoprenyl-teichoic acid--peptidoglycan teichoic acid transferase
MSGQSTRRARRTVFQRLVIVGNVFAMVFFLGAAAALAYGYDKFGQIPRVEIAEVLSDPDEVATGGEAENFLLVGVDSAEGLDPDDPVRAGRARVTGLRSDTVMILRVDPSSTRAALLSIPRDLYVPIQGTQGSDKINQAIQIGGPEGLITTIQDYFGIPINHYVQVDFFGFGKLVDALDGVPLYFPHPVRDLNSGLDVPEAGCVRLDPANALGFVRSRSYQEYVDGQWRTDGTGDLGRIQRQQVFIVEALERAFDRGLRNPVTLDALIDSGLDAVTVDDTLDGNDIISLATQFRKFKPESLDIYGLPVVSDSVGGADILRLQVRQAEPILDVFRTRDPDSVTESAVRVQVLNGTGNPGEASAASAALRAAGFSIAGTGDATDLGDPRTEIRYPPGNESGADLVARWLVNGARLVEDPAIAEVTLVTGADYAGTRDEPRPPPDTSTSSTTLPRATTTVLDDTDPSGTVAGTVPTEIPEGVNCP